MTKEKVLYQVKLILDNLNEEEYKRIRKEDLDYIYNNMEYDENITIDTSLSFDELDLDPVAYDVLERIINNAQVSEEEKKDENYIENSASKTENNVEIQNPQVEELKKMVVDYKSLVDNKDEEIKRLSENNVQLYNSIKKCPFLIRKIFFKDFDQKLLK